MQGFAQVLKMMGLDTDQIETQMKTIITAVVDKISARFDALDHRLATIEARLAAIEGHTAPESETRQNEPPFGPNVPEPVGEELKLEC